MTSYSNNSTPPKSELIQRLNRGQYSPLRRVEGEVVVSLQETPIQVHLGRHALVWIVDPRKDLTPSERSEGQVSINGKIDALMIDPTIYSLKGGKGFKAVRRGEEILLGRAHRPTRFDNFPSGVSREHASITESEDGRYIIIRDLNSKNGTYISTPLYSEAETADLLPTLNVENREIDFQVQASSIPSDSHPERNEDAYMSDTSHGIFGVFDGVGGQEKGEVASRIAREGFMTAAPHLAQQDTVEGVTRSLHETFQHINEAILNESREAATTAVVTKVYEHQGQIYAAIAHAGDSRAYLFREGKLRALTTDHTASRRPGGTREAMAQQERLANTDTMDAISPEDIAAFYQRNIIGASLGHNKTVRPDIQHFIVQKDDLLILTTDGVHDNLRTTEMETILNHRDHNDMAAALTDAAHARAREVHLRAKRDDITALAVKINSTV